MQLQKRSGCLAAGRYLTQYVCCCLTPCRMEEGYKANPYHNAMHAADVMQTLHAILTRGGLVPGYVDPLHMMACYTAAVVHDFEHGGLTNDFLVNSLDDLAVLYNDRSPLENHHLAAAFMLMRQSEFNFSGSLSKADFEKFRKIVIELVLATDMKQHFSILSHFTTVHRWEGLTALAWASIVHRCVVFHWLLNLFKTLRNGCNKKANWLLMV